MENKKEKWKEKHQKKRNREREYLAEHYEEIENLFLKIIENNPKIIKQIIENSEREKTYMKKYKAKWKK